MAKKQKYYVVWKGVSPGVYHSWTDCQLQIKGYEGALYKSFDTWEEAEQAFASSAFHYVGKNAVKKEETPRQLPENFDMNCLAVDAACSGNPGPGGWGAVLRYNGHEKEISGGEANTTNNRMELSAVINALALLKEPCKVTLYSDSQYVCNALKLGWAKKWKANNWMRNKKEKALNPELWDRLLTLYDTHEVEIVWVKGHAGHPENERCDRLAVAAAKQFA